MTRSKESEIKRMVDALQRFETIMLSYTRRLETELEAERAGQVYLPLILGLERQIAMLKAASNYVDEEMWEQMLLLANMSQSLSHRRTRRMF